MRAARTRLCGFPPKGVAMFTSEDKQILLDHAATIESGLSRIADAIPDHNNDLAELAEAVRYSGEQIRAGLGLIASAIDRHLPE